MGKGPRWRARPEDTVLQPSVSRIASSAFACGHSGAFSAQWQSMSLRVLPLRSEGASYQDRRDGRGVSAARSKIHTGSKTSWHLIMQDAFEFVISRSASASFGASSDYDAWRQSSREAVHTVGPADYGARSQGLRLGRTIPDRTAPAGSNRNCQTRSVRSERFTAKTR